LVLASDRLLRSIAFPAISTGVYGFPASGAARIAVGTVAEELAADPRGVERVIFCCFSDASAQHHADAFFEIFGPA
jgi:O-acetyl-ADP-ribose deacetylase (regulator of RNase III)